MDSDSIVNRSTDFVQSKRKQRLFQSAVAAELTLLAIFILYYTEGNVSILMSVVGCALLVSTIFILIRYDKINIGIQILLLIITFTMLFFMWFFEGTKDEVALLYPAVITFALVLGNKNMALGLIAFIIVNILAMGYVNSTGIYINEVGPPSLLSAIVTTILMALVSYSIWLISSDMRSLLTKITAENKRVAESKEHIQALLDNEKRLREQEIEVHKLKNLENIGLLAGGIAHDFNNMLTAILGNISLAKLKLDHNHPSAVYLTNSEQSIERATQLASQLLTFAKGGAPNKETLDIYTLIKETVAFDLTGSNVKATFNADCPSCLKENDCPTCLIEADRGQMQQVISNITINALQAMENGGILRVNVRDADEKEILGRGLDSGRYLNIQFSDKGNGMDEETLSKIFDLYFTTKGSGNGLGMTIVHSIIKKHNGAIAIHSELDKGTTVEILLPVKGDSVRPNKGNEKPQLPSEYDLNILILDDDVGILNMVSAMFDEKGAHVTSAQNGHDLISLYRQSLEDNQPYDVLIFDLTIPGGMGGKEAVQEIKQLNPDAICIVSSGYADDPVMANFKDYGFQAAVSKPYHLEKLYQVVADLAMRDDPA